MERAFKVTYQVFDLSCNYCCTTGADPEDYRYQTTYIYAKDLWNARKKARAFLDSIAEYEGYAKLVSVE